MRKKITVAFILTVILILTASCTPSEQMVLSPSSNLEANASSKLSGSKKETDNIETNYELKIVSDNMGLRATELSGNSFGAYGVIIKPNSNGAIIYYDYKTKQKIFLTSNPKTALDKDSTAFVDNVLGGIMPILAGNKLYMFKCGNYDLASGEDGEDGLPYIMEMDLNGKNRKKMTFPATQWLALDSAIVYGDGLFYFIYYDYDVEDPMNTKLNIGVLDFETKKLISLYSSSSDEVLKIIGVYEGGLVVQKSIKKQENDVFNKYYLFSLDEKELTEIFDKNNNPMFATVYKNKLYYIDEENLIIEKELLSGKENKIAQLELENKNIASGYIYPNAYDNHLILNLFDADSENSFYASFDINSKEIKPLNLFYQRQGEDDFVSIFCENEEYLLVNNGEKTVKSWDYNPAGERYEFDEYVFEYSLIKKEDYWNSLPNYISFTDNVYN